MGELCVRESVPWSVRRRRGVREIMFHCALGAAALDVLRAENDVFVCGNDGAAKKRVTSLLQDFGWENAST